MASSAKSIFTCTLTPFPHQEQVSKSLQSANLGFKSSTFIPQKWSISHENNHFINLNNDHITIKEEICNRHGKKLREFKQYMIKKEGESLAMIDAIQRLGIDYYFEEEIDEILLSKFRRNNCSFNGMSLHEMTLEFRLLRQAGYYVPAGVFDEFKEDGKFKQNMNDDIKGLMGLYEASQLSIEGEDILDESRDYSYNLLNSWTKRLSYPQARVVMNTLEHPYHKSLPKFTAKDFTTYFEGPNMWMKDLLELAKLDSDMAQSRYQQEVCQISSWWEDLGLANELKFARKQPLKWYVWSMGILTDSKYSEQRIELTKSISFIFLIDDIFDVHGTMEELILFTDVINRWDIDATQQLPYSMRICFNALDKVTNEISYKIYKQHGWNPIDSLRKTWAVLCKAFLVEAKWFASGQIPNSKEYLENGILSSGVHVVLVHIFFLLGHGLTRESVDFIDNNPGMISSAAAILRLWDDLGSAKDEDQNGNDGSYVECYMKENQESSTENARKQVGKMISDSWKKLNQECLFQSTFSSTYRKSCLNLARMVPLMYSYDQNNCLPLLESHVNSLFSRETASMI